MAPTSGEKIFSGKSFLKKIKRLKNSGGPLEHKLGVIWHPEIFPTNLPIAAWTIFSDVRQRIFYLDFLQRSYEGEYGSKIDFDDNVAPDRVHTSRVATSDASSIAISRHPWSGSGVDFCIFVISVIIIFLKIAKISRWMQNIRVKISITVSAFTRRIRACTYQA